MAIEAGLLRAGGTVNVTMMDGAKIYDSRISEVGGRLFILGNSLLLRDGTGTYSSYVKSVDLYVQPEPPDPAWHLDPEVVWIVDQDNDIYDRVGDRWHQVGKDKEFSYKARTIEATWGPCVPLIRAEVTDVMVERAREEWQTIRSTYDGMHQILEAAMGLPGRGEKDETMN